MIGFYSTMYESAFTGWITLATLAVVIFFTMIIQLKDDISRHIQDKEINTRVCNVARGGEKKQVHCRCVLCAHAHIFAADFFSLMHNMHSSRNYHSDVKVGDLVLVERDEQIPADLLVLTTSHTNGKCYGLLSLFCKTWKFLTYWRM